VVGGLFWYFLNRQFGGVPLVSSFFGLAVAYAIGELVSRAVNRKRGVTLAWIAGGGMVAAYLISGGFIYLLSGSFISVIFALLFLAVAVYVASSRLR
jgi:CHASE2 domain-containing sensor protein